jgi:hypothetical protein
MRTKCVGAAVNLAFDPADEDAGQDASQPRLVHAANALCICEAGGHEVLAELRRALAGMAAVRDEGPAGLVAEGAGEGEGEGRARGEAMREVGRAVPALAWLLPCMAQLRGFLHQQNAARPKY